MFSVFTRLSLVSRILIAIILGVLVAIFTPQFASYLSLLGDLFIKALKSVAPILVFVLVLSSIANFKIGSSNASIKPIMLMYADVCCGDVFGSLECSSCQHFLPKHFIFRSCKPS